MIEADGAISGSATMEVWGALRNTGWMAALVLSCGCAIAWSADNPGVSKTTIVVATIQDLSGPGAAAGRQLRDGLTMHIEQVNQEGGINGRHVRLLVEDSRGDGARAAAAARRLASGDAVFAILGQMGADQNVAAMPILFARGIVNFLPITGAPQVFDPPSKLKMAFWPSYADQMRSAMPYLIAQKHLSRPCIVFEDSTFGRDTLAGFDEAMRRLGAVPGERIMGARDAGEWPGVAQRLKAAGCDLVVLGSSVRDAAQLIGETRRLGLEAEYLGTSALYSANVRELGGRTGEGLYAVNTASYPYADDASRLVRDWAEAYHGRFNEDPTIFSVYGYCIFDLFAKAASRAGPNLSVDSLNAAMESTTFPRDMFGSPEYHITATDRLGSRKVRISQVIKGRWSAITPLIDPPASH